MKKLLVLLALVAPALGQGFQTVSIQTALAPQASFPTTTLRTSVQLVVVDVTVTDKDHHPIHNLTAKDFALLEDKVAQPIKHFEEHTSAEVAAGGPRPTMPVGTFTNFDPAPGTGPLNILLFDRFNTQMVNQSALRLQLLKYIDRAKPGTRIAIFELGDQLRLLQGFTDDRELLRTALRDRNGPVMATWNTNSNVPGDNSGSGLVGPDQPAAPTQLAHGIKGQVDCSLQTSRSQVMLDALHSLALSLGSLPGRKNLVWFSGAFPMKVFDNADPDGCDASSAADWHLALDKLTVNQVSIYPVGVRTAMGPPDPTMKELARVTGGHAFADYNSYDAAVADSIEDGSNYYTLAYTPTNSNWNGDFRKIEVTLADGRSAELSYRRGYYANDSDHLAKIAFAPKQAAGTPPRPDAMHLALTLGSPEATQILLSTQVLPMGNANEEALAPGNEGSKELKGPYRRYSVNMAADVRGMSLARSADGIRHGVAEFVAFVYATNGKLVNVVGTQVKADFNDSQYLNVLQRGFPMHEELSVPAKGEYFVRVVVHDLQGDHVGAVEVPIASVRNLPPVQAASGVVGK